MNPTRQAWLTVSLLVGVAYFLIGWAFALPTTNVQVWRLLAWAASGAVFIAHMAYERVKLGGPPRSSAWHIALAVALGAFLLAIAGMLHSLLTTSAIQPTWFLALVLWPAVTAIPAFIGALIAGAVLARFPRKA